MTATASEIPASAAIAIRIGTSGEEPPDEEEPGSASLAIASPAPTEPFPALPWLPCLPAPVPPAPPDAPDFFPDFDDEPPAAEPLPAAPAPPPPEPLEDPWPLETCPPVTVGGASEY